MEETDTVGIEDGNTAKLVVAVRIRPISNRELGKEGQAVIAQAVDLQTVLIIDPSEDPGDVLRQDRPREKLYAFDHVFSEVSEQGELFDNTTKCLVPTVLKGYNATVFAYGATGAGKTFTMLGTESNPGIMSNTLGHLFHQISSSPQPSQFEVTLSYLEIYNENIRDLLAGRADYLDLREDASHGVVVAGITTVAAKSADEVMGWLRKGNRMRTQEATGANEVSSRSHAVLQVLVGHREDSKDGHTTERFGKLSMIDLAGSERAADTKNRGMRMIEGANINRSLLALGNCINALGESGKKAKYVNFRDSKLTRLLKDSLGGNCRTVMIANISPAASNFEETMNTLKYASRARSIKTKVSQQVVHKYDPYNVTLHQLQAEIGNLRSKLTSSTSSDPTPPPLLRAASITDNDHHHRRRSSVRSPKENSMFTEVAAALDALFGEQIEAREQVVAADEAVAEVVEELGRLEKRGRRGAKAEIERLRAERGTKEAEKNSWMEAVRELEEKILSMQQTLPRSLDKRSRQYLDLLIRSHFLHMDNLDLDLNFTLSTATLEQKQRELDATSRRVHLLEQISNVQRDLLTRGGATSSEILESLQNELTRVDGGTKSGGREMRLGAERLKILTERMMVAGDGIVRQRRATVGAIMSAGSSVGSGKEKSLSAGEEEGGRKVDKRKRHHRTKRMDDVSEETEEGASSGGQVVAEEEVKVEVRRRSRAVSPVPEPVAKLVEETKEVRLPSRQHRRTKKVKRYQPPPQEISSTDTLVVSSNDSLPPPPLKEKTPKHKHRKHSILPSSDASDSPSSRRNPSASLQADYSCTKDVPRRKHSTANSPKDIPSSIGEVVKRRQSSQATTLREARDEIQREVRLAREERLRAKREAAEERQQAERRSGDMSDGSRRRASEHTQLPILPGRRVSQTVVSEEASSPRKISKSDQEPKVRPPRKISQAVNEEVEEERKPRKESNDPSMGKPDRPRRSTVIGDDQPTKSRRRDSFAF